MMKTISGKIVDVVSGNIIKGEITINNGRIVSITPTDEADEQYLIPGFIDSHIHIESSMLVPSEFARYAVIHGTIGCMADPHEIANVLGIDGINFMIENGLQTPFHFYFGAPSCVPATEFETSGAIIDAVDISLLMSRPDIYFLGEMMNFPGVIFKDDQVIKKLAAAHLQNKPVDGHAPGLVGDNMIQYVAAGITTDHEAHTLPEAEDKIKQGMKILIRNGSATTSFKELLPLLQTHPEDVMFCSDDKHPDELMNGHINKMVIHAVAKGYPLMNVLRAVSLNPVKHYNLPTGLLQTNDSADFLIVDNLKDFNVKSTYINGTEVARNGECLFSRPEKIATPNNFHAVPLKKEDIAVKAERNKMKIMEAFDKQLLTSASKMDVIKTGDSNVATDPENDILKIVVYNRYVPSPPAIAFIHGFGLKQGAIASTVAHDSHNLVAVGTTDEDILDAINELIQLKGGIAVANNGVIKKLALPVAGLMSNLPGEEVSTAYQKLNKAVHELGSHLKAPFMTLSFMSLLVIPDLKLSDKGLFDGTNFTFTTLWK